MFSFWPLFVAFIVALGGHVIADKINAKSAAIRWIFIASLVGGIYLLAGASYMAVGWEDPIGATDTSPYVHRAKDWFVVQLLRVWPFFLMFVGGLSAYISYKMLKYGQLPR